MPEVEKDWARGVLGIGSKPKKPFGDLAASANKSKPVREYTDDDETTAVSSSGATSRTQSKESSVPQPAARMPAVTGDLDMTIKKQVSTTMFSTHGETYGCKYSMIAQSSFDPNSEGMAHWASKPGNSDLAYSESLNLDAAEWCVYDLGDETAVTEVEWEFSGSTDTPKIVIVSFNTRDPNNENFWQVAKRALVPEGSTDFTLDWNQSENARWWKMTYAQSWGSTFVNVIGFQMTAEDLYGAKQADGVKGMSQAHSQQLTKLSTYFMSEGMLTDTQKETRELAKKWKVSNNEAEKLRIKFDKFDTDHSGVIDKEEFKQILVSLIKVKDKNDIPMERFDHYWREVDYDQSGEVDFEEFLIWYKQIVERNLLNPESFYATFASNRIPLLAETARKSPTDE